MEAESDGSAAPAPAPAAKGPALSDPVALAPAVKLKAALAGSCSPVDGGGSGWFCFSTSSVGSRVKIIYFGNYYSKHFVSIFDDFKCRSDILKIRRFVFKF